MPVEEQDRYVVTREFSDGKNLTITWHELPQGSLREGKLPRIYRQPLWKEVNILITGAPRSGTRTVAYELGEAGFKIGHEEYMKEGLVSWQHITPIEGMSPRCNNVIHLIRNPLLNISSIATVLHPSAFPFIHKSIGVGVSWNMQSEGIEEKLQMAMYTYYYWNKLIEEKAIWRFKIESLRKEWDILLDKLGGKRNEYKHFGLITNNYSHEVFSWDNLIDVNEDLATKCKLMGEEYGY